MVLKALRQPHLPGRIMFPDGCCCPQWDKQCQICSKTRRILITGFAPGGNVGHIGGGLLIKKSKRRNRGNDDSNDGSLLEYIPMGREGDDFIKDTAV